MNDEENLDSIYLEIGKSLHSTAGVLGFEESDLVKLGKKWVSDNISQIRSAVCEKGLLSKITKDSTESDIIILIADAFAAIITIVPPVTLAKLIVKIGIKNICK